jgi:hypothetical protein
VTVINGDLSFIGQPLLIGHYRSLSLTGTEYVMNRQIGGAMETSLKLGLYPVALGTHQVFINHNVDRDNPWRLPRPQAVIVAGLGEEGKLRSNDLLQTVRQAALAWAQRELEDKHVQFELAATLIGSGGLGISAGQSAQVIAQAVYEANERLTERNATLRILNEERKKRDERLLDEWPTVSHLYLIELYLDRAREAWRALQVQAAATDAYDVKEPVRAGQAALPRPIDSGYRGADYDFMSATSATDEQGQSVISFTLDTKRARSEVHAQSAQGELVRALLRNGWNEAPNTENIGRTLFKLLIPVEMESFLSGSSEIQIELDSGTAGIPWELLDTGGDGQGADVPWAIRTKLLRKLRTADFRLQPRDASVEDGILIIGEPKCDPKVYPPLPGARQEAIAVRDLFRDSLGNRAKKIYELISPEDHTLPGPDACLVTSTLITNNWRIVHIAGHGEPPLKIGPKPQKPGDPPQKDGPARGVVLSDGLFLGPDLIARMRPVPELVFVNCCHLAARNEGQLLREDDSLLGKPYDRASFASGVAEELIKIGVRCVIAAGWAVGDEPATAFATTFYREILGGQRFLDAVGAARAEAKKSPGNTWAAYQCYGDPDWTFRRAPADAQAPSKAPENEFAGIASPADLVVALTTLAVQSEFWKVPLDRQIVKIVSLEKRFGDCWGGNGSVGEAFGRAYAATKQTADAIRWYRNALAASDGGASIKVAEQLGNLRVRLAWETLENAARSAKANGAGGSLQAAIDAARNEIDDARKLLESLARDIKTIERQSLCGSAWKRMALVERMAGRSEQETDAIQQMYEWYLAAETQARETNAPNLFYPAMNRIAAEIIINSGKAGWEGLKRDELAAVRENLAGNARNSPDFWSTEASVELDLYEALGHRNNPSECSGKLAEALPGVERGYGDLYSSVSSMRMWSSVYDQARFILEKYSERVPSQPDKDAAQKLLTLLQQMATGTRA